MPPAEIVCSSASLAAISMGRAFEGEGAEEKEEPACASPATPSTQDMPTLCRIHQTSKFDECHTPQQWSVAHALFVLTARDMEYNYW